MKVLVTSDFYNEYELYETEDLDGLKAYINAMISRHDINLDPDKYKLLGNQDTIQTAEAIKEADETLYISDFEEE